MNWATLYRPQNFEELALSPRIKRIFTEVINKKHMGDFLFHSPSPGCGKTSLAKMLPNILNMEYIFINASKDGDVNTIINLIQNFNNFASILGNGKIVILDEAERISMAAQESLRGILEEDHLKNMHYIFTANNKSKIIDAIADSRLVPLDFSLPFFDKNDKDFINSVFIPIVKYLESILKINNIIYSKQDLMHFVKTEYPGIRRMVTKMEFSIFDGKFEPDSYGVNGLLINEDEVIELIKNGTEVELYKLSQKYKDGDFLVDYINHNLINLVEIDSFGKIIELLNEYQTKKTLNIGFYSINFLDLLYKLKKNISWK